MTVQNDELLEPGPAADADLILRTRSGDGTAFGELWRRHYPSGMAVARSVTSSIDPDDLVQESYTRIYQAILKGGGPSGSFRAYLFTSIRNTAAAWGRARRETAMDELEAVPDPDSTEQAANEALDRGLTAQAFRSLPTRWQEVLWYTEIEQMKPADVAPLLGMKAGAVSQLAFRAREGLREGWVQAHLRSTASDSECHWTIEHLGAYSRGNVSTRDRSRIDQHLEDCARCLIVAGEAKDVSSRLVLVLLPLVLGITGAAGYTALLQSGGAPVAAVAAMPSGVISGGVVVTGAGAAPIGIDGGASTAGAGASGAGASGGGISGGAITGIGALVGAGSAALVVAGVVAAATIIPGLSDASPVTSLPNAGDADSSSISSEVAPGGNIESDEKVVIEVGDDAPKDDAPKKVVDKDPTPEVDPPSSPPVADDTPTEVPEAPGEKPSGGGDGTVPTDPPPIDPPPIDPPVDPTDPTDPPVDPTDPTDPPVDPTDPPVDPTDPTDPPVDPTDPPEAVLPEGTPAWSPATQTCVPNGLIPRTEYSVPLSGAPNASVRIDVDGPLNDDDDYVAKLDENGTGTAVLKPSGLQILSASHTDVSFSYFLGDLVGEVVTISLADLYSGPSCLWPRSTTADVAPTNQAAAGSDVPVAADDPAAEPPAAEAPITDAEPAPAPTPTPAPTEPAPTESTPTAPAPTESTPTAPAPEQSAPETPAEGSAAGAPATDAPAEDTAPAE